MYDKYLWISQGQEQSFRDLPMHGVNNSPHGYQLFSSYQLLNHLLAQIFERTTSSHGPV